MISKTLTYEGHGFDLRYIVKNPKIITSEDQDKIIVPNISFMQNPQYLCGNCEQLDHLHLDSIIQEENENYGNVTFLTSQGKIFASLKWSGDNSILALNNVYDGNGNLIMVMGGAYSTTVQIGAIASYVHELKRNFSALDISNFDVPMCPLRHIDSDELDMDLSQVYDVLRYVRTRKVRPRKIDPKKVQIPLEKDLKPLSFYLQIALDDHQIPQERPSLVFK